MPVGYDVKPVISLQTLELQVRRRTVAVQREAAVLPEKIEVQVAEHLLVRGTGNGAERLRPDGEFDGNGLSRSIRQQKICIPAGVKPREKQQETYKAYHSRYISDWQKKLLPSCGREQLDNDGAMPPVLRSA